MKPITTKSRAVIEATAATAWAVLSDYANDPLWRHGVLRMEQTPPGAVHDGARVVEELRILGRTVRTDIEVRDVNPGSSFAWRALTGSDAHGTRSISPLGSDRCELVTEKHVCLAGSDRLLQPLVAWVIRRTERADARRAAAFVAERATQP
jgi:hypothetical protein